MKKTTLSELLGEVKSASNPAAMIDNCAYWLAQGLSGAEELDADDSADATSAEMKLACIFLVEKLEEHGQPPSENVVEMLKWAAGLRQRKRGPAEKLLIRDEAMMDEAAFQYRGHEGTFPPMSVRALAKRMGVSRPTVRKWRNDPDYLLGIKGAILGIEGYYIKEDAETSME